MWFKMQMWGPGAGMTLGFCSKVTEMQVWCEIVLPVHVRWEELNGHLVHDAQCRMGHS